MKVAALTVGIVDYGVGNHTSVLRCVRQLGFRAWISSLPDQLDRADVLLLRRGGVPTAMERLRKWVGGVSAAGCQRSSG